MQVTVPIRESGATVGEFVLVGDASDLVDNLLKTLRLTILCALLSVTIGLSVAARLQKGITAPLRDLTSAIERVRRTHDYAARIEATSNDEVGRLVDSFNETLSEIRKRDRELEKLALLRSPHRATQPHAVLPRIGRRAEPMQRDRCGRRAAPARSRPLQGGQRHAGPRRR